MTKKSKYGNQKIMRNGIMWDSIAEWERYLLLKDQEKRGLITDLQRQVKFVLQDGFEFMGKRIQPISYVADFVYYKADTKELVVEDVKGVQTPEFKIKRKMFMNRYGMDITLVNVE